jgi:hypothetical protein
MNYTIKQKSVIFELPLSDYLSKRYFRKFNPETKTRGEQQEKWIKSLQEYEEDLFERISDFWQEAKDALEKEYINRQEAIDYLKTLPEKYTDKEIALFSEDLDNSIIRAAENARNQSCQDEWLTKFRRLTQERIDADLSDALDGIKYNLIDRINDKDYFNTRAEADHLRLEISKAEIKKWLANNVTDTDANNIGYFADYALDFDRKPIDIDYIDHYSTMGDYDEWLSLFKHYKEVAGQIDDYRKTEAAKINNYSALLEFYAGQVKPLKDYLNKYHKDIEFKKSINRNLDSVKAIIVKKI